MKTLTALALTAALSLSAGAAAAQNAPRGAGADHTPTAEELADLQCMGVFIIMANDETKLVPAMGGYMYYLARLDSRRPQVDWIAQLAKLARQIGDTGFAPHQSRCAAVVQSQIERLDQLTGG